MNKVSTEQANAILGRLDRIASQIQEKHENLGIPFEVAKGLVNDLDRVADETEKAFFGDTSLQRRQVEIVKQGSDKEAQVLQRDTDEGYMDSYKSNHGTVKTDADEGYMSAYQDDQSSAVIHGVDAVGDPLAPGHQSS